MSNDKSGNPGNFANDREKASEAGQKGGHNSGGNFANDPRCPAECKEWAEGPTNNTDINRDTLTTFDTFSGNAAELPHGPAWAQSLCMAAEEHDCTYLFRQVERLPCRGMCSGNANEQITPDVDCGENGRLKEHSSTIPGRTKELCCDVTGMCAGNSDSSTDVVCRAPSQ